jgi:hypothetical protein
MLIFTGKKSPYTVLGYGGSYEQTFFVLIGTSRDGSLFDNII